MGRLTIYRFRAEETARALSAVRVRARPRALHTAAKNLMREDASGRSNRVDPIEFAVRIRRGDGDVARQVERNSRRAERNSSENRDQRMKRGSTRRDRGGGEIGRVFNST
jgi:hypothetical protein